jgi:hypothetical protein
MGNSDSEGLQCRLYSSRFQGCVISRSCDHLFSTYQWMDLNKFRWGGIQSVFSFPSSIGAFAKLRKATISSVERVCSVCPPVVMEKNSAPTGRISMKFDILVFFELLSIKFKFLFDMMRITSILHKDQYTFVSIPRLVLPRMRNILGKSCRENLKKIVFNQVFVKSWRLWDNVKKIF